MYETYWKLTSRPFDDLPDPRFYFPAHSHQTALLKLRYLIEQKKGIGLIVGEHGTGKSFLPYVLEHDEKSSLNLSFIRLVIPQLEPEDLLRYFSNRLGIGSNPDQTLDGILVDLESRLVEVADSSRHVVFVVDDAHLLGDEQLNVIRLLLNLRENPRVDFTILLLGRTELLSHVSHHHGLDQRIAVRSGLSPLKPNEVRGYIQHRIHVAGGEVDQFHENAHQTAWELSGGIPRKINQICDLALLVGFADQLDTLGPLDLQTASEEIETVIA
ncbi:hypothetical protein KOR42_22130 [Thalassoglobus neptunius]|uniref:ORC1/DEAH AAA+ ATPase domain-containing protein n=1 Tax=Thalassoglobus neptunius TaxID=1938619 RepID=A0A5C5X6T7_9PLAN|nr:AAA family ATPase [Thalassoglobus neptunius]TWT58827.1 hypothetical protein KOR42_22130 [Thalassoglobus neptunius]